LSEEVNPGAGFSDSVRPQDLHLVVLTPDGIFCGLMLYFLLQYKQVIFRVSGCGAGADAAGWDTGAASGAGLRAIEWPQDLHFMLVRSAGIFAGSRLYLRLQYWQAMVRGFCFGAEGADGAGCFKGIEFPHTLHLVLVTWGGILLGSIV
jgi:hypothetical protein